MRIGWPRSERGPGLALAALLCVVVVITLPRFNQNDWLIGQFTGTSEFNLADAEQYVAVSRYIAGEVGIDNVLSPYDDRPLLPALAAISPLDELTTINIVNLLSLVVATWAVVRTAEAMGLTGRRSLLAGVLFGVSFPVFFYGTIGYVDATVMAGLALGLLATVKRQWLVVAVLLAVAVMAKESAGALAAPAIVYAWFSDRRRFLPIAFGFVVVAGASLAISRGLITANRSASWNPSLDHARRNLSRTRTFAAIALTLGAGAGIVAVGLLRTRSLRQLTTTTGLEPRALAALATGVAVAAAQGSIGLFTVFLDGRYVWGATVYLSIAAAALVGRSFAVVQPSAETPPDSIRGSGPHVLVRRNGR